MDRLKATTLFLYRHHFVRYLLVGGTTFVIDFGLLILIHSGLNFGIAASTSVAYWVSIIYNFILNRYWTFDAREKDSLQRHITSYFLLLVINYLFVVVFVSFASDHISYIIAKAIAVVIQMIWTYPIYKKVIFISGPVA
ncbi:MAG TPA: GtrA family protein [Candidatus Saccharimonadales bacterium]|nr:GtrA family protein [Candidatus Saccharimonadales bacterium]